MCRTFKRQIKRDSSILSDLVYKCVQVLVQRRSQVSIIIGILLGFSLSAQFVQVQEQIVRDHSPKITIGAVSEYRSLTGHRLSRSELDKRHLRDVLQRLHKASLQSIDDEHADDGEDDDRMPLIRRHLFVGVLTAKKFLDTRALTIRNTWGRHLKSNLLFFSSSGSR